MGAEQIYDQFSRKEGIYFMAEAAIFLADGVEEIEALTVVDLLRRAGIDIDMVSINGSYDITGSHGIGIKLDRLMEDVNWDELKILVLPGGMPGTKHLMACSPLTDKLKEFNENGKLLAAICAAPTVLGVNGILEGRKATCYPGCEDNLHAGEYLTESVVECDNVITSRGLGTAIDFAGAIIAKLRDKALADDVLDKVIYTR